MKPILMSTPIRIQRKRTKGFKLESPNGLPIVYVGRGSKWGNPFRVVDIKGEWYIKCEDSDIQAQIIVENCHLIYLTKTEAVKDAIKCYEIWLFPYTHESGNMRDLLVSLAMSDKIKDELKGRNLACWCPLDQECHAETLLEYANQ